MKIVGVLLFAYAAYEILSRLTAAEKRRMAEAEGLYLLLVRMKEDIRACALPLTAIYESFEDQALEACGFLSVLRTQGMRQALSSGTLFLPAETKRQLLLYVGDVGTHFLEEEIQQTEKAVAALTVWMQELRAELPRRIKVKRTVFLSGAGMLLLFLL